MTIENAVHFQRNIISVNITRLTIRENGWSVKSFSLRVMLAISRWSISENFRSWHYLQFKCSKNNFFFFFLFFSETTAYISLFIRRRWIFLFSPYSIFNHSTSKIRAEQDDGRSIPGDRARAKGGWRSTFKGKIANPWYRLNSHAFVLLVCRAMLRG